MQPIHLIGNAHLDPVWLWRWQEGFAEIKATFRSALDRLTQFDDFVFTCAGACYYEWVEHNAPEMFAEVKARVAEGRWVIVGGWWIQPDCNQPSGEAFARHGLYSQRYFLEKFGVMAKVGYNVDSFGHNGNIPQLLRKQGMEAYVMMRPGTHENPDVPVLFQWQGVDGSRVPTYRIPDGYGWWHDEGEKMERMQAIQAAQDIPLMFFYGVGNHGGGPTVRNIVALHKTQQEQGAERFPFSSPNAFFSSIDPAALPVWADDLQHHASGCYSTATQIKAMNRKTEGRLQDAEAWAVVADKVMGFAWDASQIRKAWTNVLFNSFHDIAGGCSIKEAYDDARESYGHSLNIAAELQNGALQRLSWAVDTMGDVVFPNDKDLDWSLWEQKDAQGNSLGTPVVVFNPLNWEVTAPVQMNRTVKGICDDQKQPVALQTCRSSQTNGTKDRWNTVFLATVPALGYRLYWVYLDEEKPAAPQGMLEATDNIMENDWFKLTFEKHTGYLSSVYDKKAGREVLSAPGAVPVVVDEHDSDTWGHMIFRYNREVARFADGCVKIMEQGDVRVWMRATNRYNGSTLTQDFILYRAKPDIEVRVTADWHEHHKMLKLSFPVAVTDPSAHYEIPFGAITRPANGEEEPGHRWVDVDGRTDKGTYGLALVNDAKYSYDVQDSDLRMTVVRGAIWADHYGDRDEWCEFMDQGMHKFTYHLLPHTGSWQDVGPVSIPALAAECNHPLTHVMETYHQGPLGAVQSYVSVEGGSKGQLMVSALKPAEDGKGIVVRVYEACGKAVKGSFQLPLWNATWQAEFGAFECKTFYVDSTGVREVDMLEL